MRDQPHCSYEPDAATTRHLQGRLLELLGAPIGGLGIVELPGSHPCADLFRCVERRVLHKAFGHLVAHTGQVMAQQYGPYDTNSSFIGIVDITTGSVLGTLRTIRGNPNKTIIDLDDMGHLDAGAITERYGLVTQRTWDIASVAVLPDVLSGRVSTMLYRTLYLSSIRDGIEKWTSIIDSRVLSSYHRLGIPFERLGGLDGITYLGSAAIPCVLEVADIRKSMSMVADQRTNLLARRATQIIYGSVESPHGGIDLREERSSFSAVQPSRGDSTV